MDKPTHEISAVYFPKVGEVELTWRDLITGNRADVTFPCDKKTGELIADAVSPCVYHDAITLRTRITELEAENADLKAEIEDGWIVSHEIMERKVEELEAEIAKLKRIAQEDAEIIGGKG